MIRLGPGERGAAAALKQQFTPYGIVFDPEDLDLRAQERLHLENDLRQAIDRRELSLHYQPRICARTGALRVSLVALRMHS